MNFLSLFAGVGGFDLGFERAGMTTVGQVENDKHANRVLEHHWPHVPRWEDIHDYEGTPGAADLIVGGFPCQDYSVAGHGAGLAGDRGGLWWQMHRIVGEIRPLWVVGENVAGLTNRRHRRSLVTIVDSLVDLGYGVCWRILDSQYFGVAQRRRRLFIVGHSGGQPRPEVLALAEGLRGDPAPGREAGQDVAPTITARTRGGGGLGTDFDLDGGVIPFAVNQRHEGVRRLTHLECERLQGFPDHWTAQVSGTQRYRQMGNAVTVNVAEWIGRRLVAANNA